MGVQKIRVPVVFSEDETVVDVTARLAKRGLKLSSTFRGAIEAEPADESYLAARLREAKRRMGTGWVGHPGYATNPRHSNNPEIYKPARQEYLNTIAQRAAADRHLNPAYETAQRIVRAVSM
jgi:hypothetical protein